MVSRPYKIWSPPYQHNSGGLRVLRRLADLLRESGAEVEVSMKPGNNNGDTVAIYPEITWGNPFGVKHVVRYICCRPGLIGGPVDFPKTDLLVWYDSVLNSNPAAMCLTIPTIELDLFNTVGVGKRDTTCYWIGKGRDFMDCAPTGEIKITPEWPPTRKDLAVLLKRSKVLYSYDSLTALNTEAPLCGCPVVIMKEGCFKRGDVDKTEFGTAGRCWDPKDIDWAIETLPFALSNYMKVENALKVSLERFIEVTQKMN